MTTTSALETLTRDECEMLLQNGSVGRLAVVIDGQPHIVPVNYRAEGTTIAFRTGQDTILSEASLRKVAFEVDGIQEPRRTGWSVSVHGYGREITDGVDAESQHLQDAGVDSWAPEGRNRWFKIVPASITGRYLGPPNARRAGRAVVRGIPT